MTGSKYNEGYSFNPSSFLYLQPEIQVRENLSTVEEANDFYLSVKDDPTMADEVNEYIWSLVNIPKKFDPLIYLIAYKFQINVSPLNKSIRQSLLLDGFSEDEIYDEAGFRSSIKSVAKVIGDNLFKFDTSGQYEITAQSMQIGDILQIQPVGTNLDAHTVIVEDIIDSHTFQVRSKYCHNIFSDVGRPYDVVGILIYDLERLTRINYLRYLINNDEPQSIISVLDTEFNTQLYQTLYPITRKLDNYSAYQDYIENKLEDKKTIGKVDDIIRIIRGIAGDSDSSNNALQGPSAFFTDITVTERVLLDFNDTGYLRFNDQYIHYITNNHIRPSRDINNAFPGLITEWAIKKYFEDCMEKLVLETLETASNIVTNGEFTMNGDLTVLGNSNLLMNTQMCNADIVSACIYGIDGEDAMIFLNRDSNVIAYIHDDGMFVSSFLGVNVDLPEYNVDIDGDMRVTGPIYFGSNLKVDGLIDGDINGIDGYDTMVFLNRDSNVIAYIHDDGMFVSSFLGVNVDLPEHNVDIDGDMRVTGPIHCGSDLKVDGLIEGNINGIDGYDTMVFLNRNSNVIAYFHDDGMFLSSFLGVNVDLPEHTVDIDGDMRVTGPIYFGSNLKVDGLIEGDINGIDGYDTMVFMNRDSNVIAYLHDEGIFVSSKIGINVDIPQFNVDIDGDMCVSGSVIFKTNLSIEGSLRLGTDENRDLEGICKAANELSNIFLDVRGDVLVLGSMKLARCFHVCQNIEVGEDVKAYSFITHHVPILPSQKIPLTNVLGRLKGIHGYSIEDTDEGKRGFGLASDEILEGFPDAIRINTDGSYDIRYSDITTILVSGIKELGLDIDDERESREHLSNAIFTISNSFHVDQQSQSDELRGEIQALSNFLAADRQILSEELLKEIESLSNVFFIDQQHQFEVQLDIITTLSNEINDDLSTISTRLDSNESSIQNLDTRVSENFGSITSISTFLDSNQELFQQLQLKIDIVEEKVATFNARINSTEASIVNLDSRVSAIEEELIVIRSNQEFLLAGRFAGF